MRRDISLARTLAIYGLGLLTGVQSAIYLWDTWDDGVSEPTSGLIAIALIAISIAVIIFTFRRRKTQS
jgi:hypothetical protein